MKIKGLAIGINATEEGTSYKSDIIHANNKFSTNNLLYLRKNTHIRNKTTLWLGKKKRYTNKLRVAFAMPIEFGKL